MRGLAGISRSAIRSGLCGGFRHHNIGLLGLARFYSSDKFPAHTVIRMPALSPTMMSGNLASWSKKEGDQIQSGDVLAEVETDKATMDYEYTEDAYLAKILLAGGSQDVPVGKPIAVSVENEEDIPAFKDFTPEDAGDGGEQKQAEETPKEEEKKPEPSSKPEKPEPTPTPPKPEATVAPSGRIFASPLAKSIAIEKGISLKNVKGSGPSGRILAKDIEKEKPAAAAAPATPSAESAYEDIPLTNMRKTIASRLLQSTQNLPSYIVQSQVSVTKLLKLRQALNSAADGRYKLSINDLFVKAMTVASTRMPQVNAHWIELEGVIRQFANVDVSVAVATPTGLITPIVRNANVKGLAAISNETKQLAKKAKDGKLKPEEFQGGTITISNLGMNPAVNAFTSIINLPAPAIVAIGTLDKKAVPSDVNEQGFVFEDTITLTGSFDHRIIDGALGGEYMRVLKTIVENPFEMLV